MRLSRMLPRTLPYWGLGGHQSHWNCRDGCKRIRSVRLPLCELPREWPCPWCRDRVLGKQQPQKPRWSRDRVNSLKMLATHGCLFSLSALHKSLPRPATVMINGREYDQYKADDHEIKNCELAVISSRGIVLLRGSWSWIQEGRKIESRNTYNDDGVASGEGDDIGARDNSGASFLNSGFGCIDQIHSVQCEVGYSIQLRLVGCRALD